MKNTFLVALIACLPLFAQATPVVSNPLINYQEFQRIVMSVARQRATHRLTEEAFLRAMRENGVVLLDARTESRFRMRHIEGAINLPFTEFNEQSLSAVIRDKATKILIYCNNNFSGDQRSFAPKAPAASLNLSTYTSLAAYGYTNVFELGPLLDVATTHIPFQGANIEPSNRP